MPCSTAIDPALLDDKILHSGAGLLAVMAGEPDYLLHFVDARCIGGHTMRRGFSPEVQT